MYFEYRIVPFTSIDRLTSIARAIIRAWDALEVPSMTSFGKFNSQSSINSQKVIQKLNKDSY